MSKKTIKCGRGVYELRDGDVVMDNGNCRQLVTRQTQSMGAPLLSKVEFRRYRSMANVTEDPNHKYGDKVTLWKFSTQAD